MSTGKPNQEDRMWLVKSNSSVDGPFLFDEVIDSIFKGDVHVLDEIKGPFERWRPIRDHSLFAAAIAKLRATTYQRREYTITETVDIATQSGLDNLTQTQTQTSTETENLDDSTQTVTITSDIGTGAAGSESTPLPDYPYQTPEPGTQPPPPMHPQQRRHAQRSGSNFLVILLLLGAIGGAGWFLVNFKENRIQVTQGNAFDEYTDKGTAALKMGDYKEALKFFNTANGIRNGDPNLMLYRAPLLVQIDGKSGEVLNTMKTFLSTHYQKEYTLQGENIVGLSHSYNGDHKKAYEAFEKSVNVDSQYFPALYNRGYEMLILKQGQDVVKKLRKMVQYNSREPIGHYLLTRALVEEGIRTGDAKMIAEGSSISEGFAEKFRDFRQETMFFNTLAKYKLGLTGDDLAKSVRNFLAIDPELTNLHAHDISWNFRSFNWAGFSKHCGDLAEALGHYNGKLLTGFCQYKTGKILKAKSIFENLLSQRKNDGVLQALYTATLFALNDDGASSSLEFIKDVERPKPLVEVLLRGCIDNNDMACAQRVVRSPAGNQIMLLYTYWSLAELGQDTKKEKARQALTQGLVISPNFKPLLRLRGKM